MLTFSRLFTYSFSNNFHMLGRWIINYDDNIIYTKIDQANEDHCGCCNSSINKNSLKSITIKNNIYNNDNDHYDDEYYRAFFM